AVQSERGRRLEVPVRRDSGKRRNGARRDFVHEPEHVVPGVVAPENVCERAETYGADPIEIRAVTIDECRHCCALLVDGPVSTTGLERQPACIAMQAAGIP